MWIAHLQLLQWLIQSSYMAVMVSVMLCASVLISLQLQWVNSDFLLTYLSDIEPYLYVLLCAVFPTFLLLLLCACVIPKEKDDS